MQQGVPSTSPYPVSRRQPDAGISFQHTKGFRWAAPRARGDLPSWDSDSIGSTQSPGQIEAWNGGAKFVVETSPRAAAAARPRRAPSSGAGHRQHSGPELVSPAVANARVDIFNSTFASVSNLRIVDPHLPFATPLRSTTGRQYYVSYGKHNAQKTDVSRAPASVSCPTSTASRRAVAPPLVSQRPWQSADEPWAGHRPGGLRPFAGDLLVGNLVNGWINAIRTR